MKFVKIFIVAAIALLSIAAGLAKVMQSPQEIEFLQGLGLSVLLIMVFGAVQVAGGVLLAPKKTRMTGAVLVTLGFALSAMLIFIGGNVVFGLMSLIPAVLAAMIVYQTMGITRKKSPGSVSDDVDPDNSDSDFKSQSHHH